MEKNISLEQRLKEQLSQQSQSLEDATQSELQSISKRLNDILKKELATIERDFHQLSKKAYWRIQLKQLMFPFLAWGIALMLLFLGLWVAKTYYEREIEPLKQTQKILKELNGGIQLTKCGKTRRPCVLIDPEAPAYKADKGQWQILEGE